MLAAAKVGGILANNTYPVDFLCDNLRIQTNVLDAALEQRRRAAAVPRLLCIYPKFAPQPIREDSLLTGHLEPTNDAYAIAKIAGILRSRRCAASMACPGSRRCRRTSTGRATTSPRPVPRAARPDPRYDEARGRRA